MSKFKIVGMMVMITFTMGMILGDDAVAAEKGKVTYRQVNYVTTIHTLKVPDVEGHTNTLIEAKGISFFDKWGSAVTSMVFTMDLIKGIGTFQGYTLTTYPDGSTTTAKFEGKSTAAGTTLTGVAVSEGTWTYTKGTGKFQGIQGGGPFKSYVLAPGQFYSDNVGEYTLP